MKNKININELNKQFENMKIDLFINCISFEDRCTKISLSLNADRIGNALCFMNLPSEFDKTPKEKNKSILESHFKSLLLSNLNKGNPVETAKTIFTTIKAHISQIVKPNIVVDITTFTHESLLVLLKTLSSLKTSIQECWLTYNPAQEYAPSIINQEEKWLSKGISEIRTVLGFPGNFDPLKKFHLILLAGIEYERASKLIEEFEPSKISIGLPYEEDSPAAKSYELNLSKYKRLLSIYDEESIRYFKFSAYDPEETKSFLKDHIDLFKSYNNVIAPLNNKLSTVGVGLYCLDNPDVQICYPIPVLHNLEYSISSDKVYLYKFI